LGNGTLKIAEYPARAPKIHHPIFDEKLHSTTAFSLFLSVGKFYQDLITIPFLTITATVYPAALTVKKVKQGMIRYSFIAR
jgi:hypothetical protein